MPKFILSKSTFLYGVQCKKRLYLHKRYPELRDELTESQEALFRRGTDVGILARNLFPGGDDASPEDYSRFFDSIPRTRKLIKGGAKIIYEAAFEYDNTVTAIDILVKTRGGWRGYEVKSSTGVTDVHYLDAAVQYYVITGSGIDLKDISIIHLNNQYVRRGELDLNELFSTVSVRQEVLEHHQYVKENIPVFLSLLRKRTIPDISIGPHCDAPYECDFKGHCWKHVPEYSVFEIGGLRNNRKFELYENGIVNMADISDDYPLSEGQRLQVESMKAGKPYIDIASVREFIKSLRYPLYFFDLETFNPAVPLFDKSRPYQQIPFQFSIHYKSSKRSRLEHFGFLADAGPDPRPALIRRFLEYTDSPGDIIVYNQTFELTRLRELARDFPEYERDIQNRIDRIKDLMIPFRAKSYYTPGMRGSHSIKSVLPELVPDLTYENLFIGDGDAAMRAYEQLLSETDHRRVEQTRTALLEYCKLDTYAMVRILEVLEGVK